MAAVDTPAGFVTVRTLGGWPVAITVDGRLRPVVRGGEGPTDPPATPPPPAPTPPPAAGTPAPDLAGLQTALDAAKADGSNQALQPFMDMIGAKTPAELQAWVTDAKKARDASLTDEQRRQADLDTREAALTAREAASAAIARAARVQAALLTAGAPPATAAKLVALVALPDGDLTDEQLATAVAATKTEFAPLFAAPPGTPPPAPSGRAPGGAPPAPAGATDPEAAGRQWAQAAAKARTGATKEDLFAAFSPRPSPLAPSNN